MSDPKPAWSISIIWHSWPFSPSWKNFFTWLLCSLPNWYLLSFLTAWLADIEVPGPQSSELFSPSSGTSFCFFYKYHLMLITPTFGSIVEVRISPLKFRGCVCGHVCLHTRASHFMCLKMSQKKPRKLILAFLLKTYLPWGLPHFCKQQFHFSKTLQPLILLLLTQIQSVNKYYLLCFSII